MRPLKVVTYNVHSCVGVDGKHDPSRIAGVLKEINADIIGLQEVDTSLFYEPLPHGQGPVLKDRRKHRGSHRVSEAVYATQDFEPVIHKPADAVISERCHQLDYLRGMTGYTAVEGLLMERKAGLFGNVLLSPFPVKAVRRVDLTIRGGRQRRGALDVDLEIDGEPLRVFVSHLGLAVWERHFQVRRLVKALGHDSHSRIIMMGDFNLFTSVFPRMRRLHRRLGNVPLTRTFPSFYPIMPLDRVWVQPRPALKSLEPHKSPLARVASDHLPLVATIQF
jgi:endonuclease/exonuclease/phosphatase family metal-dependent hydrolase